MQGQAIKYDIIGEDMQSVEITLGAGETIIAEAGAMTYMNDAIRLETMAGDGTPADDSLRTRLMTAGKRLFTGQSLFMTHFTNTSEGQRQVAFSASYPGKVVPLDLSRLGNAIFCQRDAFLCASPGTEISHAFTQRFGRGFFAGDGFTLYRLQGNGLVFVHAGGELVKKVLKNETLLVDTGSIVALTEGIDYGIQQTERLRSLFFGRKGLVLTTLNGTGTVLLQTLPLARMADRMLQHIPIADRRPKPTKAGSTND